MSAGVTLRRSHRFGEFYPQRHPVDGDGDSMLYDVLRLPKQIEAGEAA